MYFAGLEMWNVLKKLMINKLEEFNVMTILCINNKEVGK